LPPGSYQHEVGAGKVDSAWAPQHPAFGVDAATVGGLSAVLWASLVDAPSSWSDEVPHGGSLAAETAL